MMWIQAMYNIHISLIFQCQCETRLLSSGETKTLFCSTNSDEKACLLHLKTVDKKRARKDSEFTGDQKTHPSNNSKEEIYSLPPLNFIALFSIKQIL